MPAHSLVFNLETIDDNLHSFTKLSQKLLDLVSRSKGPLEPLAKTRCLKWPQDTVQVVNDVLHFNQAAILEFLSQAGSRFAVISQELCKVLVWVSGGDNSNLHAPVTGLQLT